MIITSVSASKELLVLSWLHLKWKKMAKGAQIHREYHEKNTDFQIRSKMGKFRCDWMLWKMSDKCSRRHCMISDEGIDRYKEGYEEKIR